MILSLEKVFAKLLLHPSIVTNLGKYLATCYNDHKMIVIKCTDFANHLMLSIQSINFQYSAMTV